MSTRFLGGERNVLGASFNPAQANIKDFAGTNASSRNHSMKIADSQVVLPYVFPGRFEGKSFSDLKRQFEKAGKGAKLEGVTFHTLRHTVASHLVMAGVDLTTVKEILRHKNISMTLRYSHLSAEHKKSAVEALSKSITADAAIVDKTA